MDQNDNIGNTPGNTPEPTRPNWTSPGQSSSQPGAGPTREPLRPLPTGAPHYQYSYTQQPPRKRGRGILRVIFILAFIGSLVLNFLLFVALGMMGLAGVAGQDYDTVLVDGSALTKETLLIVDVTGVLIEAEDTLLATGGRVGDILRQLEMAADNDDVKGVLLMVDSPGGGVTSSDLIHRQVKRIRDSGKPVVAYVKGMGASGAYYASAPANYIVASPTSLVGSIGVIIRTYNFSKAGDKLGIESVAIASGDHKNLLDPLKPVEQEHRKMLQQLVDSMQQRFLAVVKEGRGMSDAELGAIDDGRVFTPDEAARLKLIDEIGYQETALAKLKTLSGYPNAKIVKMQRKMGFLDLLRQQRQTAGAMQRAASDLSTALIELQRPRIMYMWDPQL